MNGYYMNAFGSRYFHFGCVIPTRVTCRALCTALVIYFLFIFFTPFIGVLFLHRCDCCTTIFCRVCVYVCVSMCVWWWWWWEVGSYTSRVSVFSHTITLTRWNCCSIKLKNRPPSKYIIAARSLSEKSRKMKRTRPFRTAAPTPLP